ncbi:U11/U12 small nuclear ribonucleoprotein 48 kDa protein isoform X2 [Iris pallida]|uniref:U11/U12 small nuclear ribonucleoprotein 48 kDa protein isoform X2 n=2 Tax=Iris pallida TaxID=29817 RepID=A0AAX6IA37_IRIPA|nr:U11/U12 small nuclear ribonucleoprotein 48 kDa protein isoform X2 [Iris pallida]
MEPSPNPNPNSDLSATISLLSSLSSLAESTISSFLHLLQNPNPPSLLPCPHDPRHRIPPESLFRHSLLCPSGDPVPADPLLQVLRYTQTLNPHSQTLKLSDPDADLCFSLDAYLSESPLASNFFYRDCPGVVATPDPPDPNRTFVLPAALSKQCANFVDAADKDRASEGSDSRILPSELWAVEREAEGWRDFPRSCSYSATRVFSGFNRAEERELKGWVISNSPKFGIVIDAAMRDHVFLLLKLCLGAVRWEAVRNLESWRGGDGVLDVKGRSFECPALVGSLTWLASQLSVLYGEANGRFFALGMLKESVIRAGSSLVMFRSDGESPVGAQQSSGDCNSGGVFVSQVAAAVAALHERFLLEQRINALRYGKQLPKYQRVNEYLYASARASELRGKRPNYRPLLEHDGLLWQRSNNQDSGRAKTREELLAEERDYKRRRMSYRGKKVKRNPTEVLRDIIEEHMEEIKEAGGIGCNVKSTDTVLSSYQCNSQTDTNTNIHDPQKIRLDASEISTLGYRKPLHSEYNFTSRKDGNHYSNIVSKTTPDSQDPQHLHGHGLSELREDPKKSRHNSEKPYGYGYPSVHRSPSHPYDRDTHLDRHAHQNREGDKETLRTKYDKKGSSDSYRYMDQESRSTLTSKYARETSREGRSYTSKCRSNNKGSVSESSLSGSASQDGFEDRYDPSKPYDAYDTTSDDVSVASNYLRSEKHHGATNDAKYTDEQLRHVHSSQRHRRDHYKR